MSQLVEFHQKSSSEPSSLEGLQGDGQPEANLLAVQAFAEPQQTDKLNSDAAAA